MRGRPPKPTALKRLNGNPGKRPLPENEPQPSIKKQTVPAFLNPEARTEWKRIVPELEKMGLLTVVDRTALEGYCIAYAKWRLAEEYINKHGLIYESMLYTRDGKELGMRRLEHPEVSIAHQTALLILKYCAEFGFTPSARVRLNAGKKVEDDAEMEGLID